MLPLAERHAARAQRKADNAAESTANNSDGLGYAHTVFGELVGAVAALTPDQKAEFTATVGDVDFSAMNVDRSIAENADGGLAMAGVGVVNREVTPGAAVAEINASEGQTGVLPATDFDPAKGNANGQAIDAAVEAGASGWGAAPVDENAPASKSKKAAAAPAE